MPSSEAEVSWRGAWPLSETEVHPRGTGGRLLVGSLRLFGSWALFCLGPRPCVATHELCV
jgi:hypothetical protein